eukprot:2049237-Prymnesium_polylepis.1
MLGSSAPPSEREPGGAAAGASPGLISLAFRDLLARLKESAVLSAAVPGKPHRFRLRGSCVEVYNEQCNDLLAPGRQNLRERTHRAQENTQH